MKEIIVATGNQNKVREIREMLPGYRVRTVDEVCPGLEIIENGKTFEENAVIKARTVCDQVNRLTLADDSGLVIDYLNGEPGIYSARYLGHDTPYEEKNRIILERMRAARGMARSARFICAIAIAWPDGRNEVFRGVFEGRIAEMPAGEGGFGYDPIFYVPEFGMTAAEMSPARKNACSHRGRALRSVAEHLGL
ncbi:MAG: RdgB/HAM1 family non-canonical purine NTP pyrophosphatase [Eubacteriales bacterium]|nr:RdgB/HAM1 family non-canonical purine NTP pyrophosphatase [Eubacteriales bacterium]